jgi:hypothetical protein
MADLGCQMKLLSFVTPDGQHDEMLSAAAERYFADFRKSNARASIPIDIDGIEASWLPERRRGDDYVDAITGNVSPCIRATRDPIMQRTITKTRAIFPKFLNSAFCSFRKTLPESGSTVAFHRAEAARAKTAGTAMELAKNGGNT